MIKWLTPENKIYSGNTDRFLMVAVLAGIYKLALIVSNCETNMIENLLIYTKGISALVVWYLPHWNDFSGHSKH